MHTVASQQDTVITPHKCSDKRRRLTLVALLGCLSMPFSCAMEPEMDSVNETGDIELGVNEEALRCNWCEDDPDKTGGSTGGPAPTPSSPAPDGWMGMHPDALCVLEMIFHPAGYVGNRTLIPLLRDAGILKSLDDCYGMAAGKAGIAEAVTGFLSSGGSVADPITQLAVFNIGSVNRCVCEEYKW